MAGVGFELTTSSALQCGPRSDCSELRCSRDYGKGGLCSTWNSPSPLFLSLSRKATSCWRFTPLQLPRWYYYKYYSSNYQHEEENQNFDHSYIYTHWVCSHGYYHRTSESNYLAFFVCWSARRDSCLDSIIFNLEESKQKSLDITLCRILHIIAKPTSAYKQLIQHLIVEKEGSWTGLLYYPLVTSIN